MARFANYFFCRTKKVATYVSILVFAATAAYAVDNDKKYLEIDYSDWAAVLDQTVMETGRSDRRPAPKIKSQAGTRLSKANPNPTRLEANRVFFHALGEDNLDFIRRIRDSLARLPSDFPLDTLNAEEQLAYWLNIHNIAVYLSIAEEYPVTNLRDLNTKLWQRELLEVEGRMWSLAQIERMVVRRWRNPLVIYGFYNGAIGGPNLRTRPFTGKTVWADLEKNAEDFVNSLRGMQLRQGVAHVSEQYELLRPVFEDFDANLSRHLKAYASPVLLPYLEQALRFKPDISDWYIADLYNGQLGLGTTANTNPSEFVWIVTGPSSGVGSLTAAQWTQSASASKFPAHVRTLLVEIQERNRRLREPEVTVEEFIDDSSQ